MEDVPQQPKRSKGISIFAAVVGMIVTFLGGIYVGIHPNWIPISSGTGNEPLPAVTSVAQTQPSTSHN